MALQQNHQLMLKKPVDDNAIHKLMFLQATQYYLVTLMKFV